jgi:hypothetical protein
MPRGVLGIVSRIHAVGRDFEDVLIAFMRTDGHTQADRVLSEMDATAREQLEAACRAVLGAIEAQR